MDMNLLKRMKKVWWLTGSEIEKLIGDLRQANGVGVDYGTVDVLERQKLCPRNARSLVCAKLGTPQLARNVRVDGKKESDTT